MRDNVNKVLERDEKLSELDQRAGWFLMLCYVCVASIMTQSFVFS